MTDYTKTTNFAAKDSLPSGNANKIVKGTEIDTEFNNIATASATKANIASPTFTGTVTIPTADINGGAVDATTIGASSASSIVGTTVVANTSINIAGDGATVTGIKDEDDMSSNSATKLATQQSIKAYVDSQVTAQDLDVTDGSSSIDIDLDSESLGILGGTGLSSTASGTSVTLAIDSTVATLTGSQTLTNKTLTAPTLTGTAVVASLDISGDVDVDGTLETDALSINGTTVTSTAAELNILDGVTSTAAELNILDGVTSTTAELNILDGVTSTAAELNILDGKAFLDEDNMASNSATGIASQQSIKAYVDSQVTAQDLDVTDGSTSIDIDLDSESLGILGGTGIDSAASGTGVTLSIDSTVATLTGSQTLTNKTLTAPTLTGTAVVASLDISGDVDVDGTLETDALSINGTTVTSTAAELNILDGVTSTAAELNILDGVTATTAELNYVDGVTSAIQTQIDAKAPIANPTFTGSFTSPGIDDNADAIAITIDSSENVGIGTGSPSSFYSTSLVVNVPDEDGITIVSPTTGLGYLMFADGTSGNARFRGFIGYEHDGDLMQFATSGVERFRIASDGSLSTPTSGTSNVRFGVNAGNSIASGGNYNVVVGDEAGTALTTGDSNVAIGFEALKTEDAHGSNVAVGYQALSTQDAGSDAYNTAVGASAGASVTTGVQNTIVGGLALDAATTGAAQTAIGYAALTSDTRGQNSTAVGHNALSAQNFTTATNAYNTAVGSQAGGAVTTGTNNVLVGGLAGDALTDADANVAIGKSALSADTLGSKSIAIGLGTLQSQNFTTATDSFNVAVGHGVGASITTGIYNVLIGGQAGDAITDADFNVALGTNSLSTNVLGSQNVAIGNAALNAMNPSGAVDTYNTAVGASAGLSVTTGAHVTIVGGLAGDALTTAEYTAVFGSEALGNETGGTLSTALGYAAGFSQNVTSGASGNTNVGAQAGFYNVTGTNNTRVGYNAGVGASGQSNSNNTIVGSSAGSAITTGNTNTFLGKDAGDILQTGNNNVCIGNNVNPHQSNGANQIAIGHDFQAVDNNYFSFGKASNVVSNQFTVNASWSRSSDQRLKKDITDSTLGLSFINDLRTVKYSWKASHELDSTDAELAHLYKEDPADNQMDTGVYMHNFIAQEVKEALDTAGVSDFGGWGVDQYNVQQVSREMFVIPLVKAVQELSAQVTALQAEVNTLKGG